MSDPYDVVKTFEQSLCDYTGSRFAVVMNSCTMALLISCAYLKHRDGPETVRIPSRTYVSVPQAVLLAGHKVRFTDLNWEGMYQLYPLPVWDAARWLTSGMYCPGNFMCVSFHWTKHLQIGLGGAILHDDEEADPILRRMRFDGRAEGVEPKDDEFPVLGYHAYLTPALAAEGLTRLSLLPKHNDPLPNSDYADCSEKFGAFV